MEISTDKTAVEKAQEYYDSTPADEFYFKIWGGEHIHVGIYDHPDESIKDASPRIVHKMAKKVLKWLNLVPQNRSLCQPQSGEPFPDFWCRCSRVWPWGGLDF